MGETCTPDLVEIKKKRRKLILCIDGKEHKRGEVDAAKASLILF